MNQSSSGFGRTSEIKPNFEFNSPATPKMGGPGNASFSPVSGTPRPRFVRTRKSAGSRSMGSSEIREINLGFNPLRSVSDNLTGISSGLNCNDHNLGREADNESLNNKNDAFNLKVANKVEKAGSALIHEIKKLRVESQKGNKLTKGASASFSGIQLLNKGIDNISLSKIPESKSVFDGFEQNHEASLSLSGGHKVDQSKKNRGDGSRDFLFGAIAASGFVFGSYRKSNDPISPGLASTFPQRIENLNIEDSDKIDQAQKVVNADKARQAFEMDKKIGGDLEVPISDVHVDTSCSSSLRKEPCQNIGDGDVKKLNYPEYGSYIREQSNKGSGPHQASASSTLLSPCEKKEGFSLSDEHDDSKMLHVEFRTSAPKGDLTTRSKKIKSGAKKAVKGTLSRGRKGKAKEHISVFTNSFPNDPALSKSRSRMDASPYQEIEGGKQSAGECSLASDNLMENNQGNHVSQRSIKIDVAEKGSLNVSEVEGEIFMSTSENLDRNGENNVGPNADAQNCDQTQHLLSSNSVRSRGSSFTFGASSSDQAQANVTMRQMRKKLRMKAGRDFYIPPRTTALDDTSSSLQTSPIPRVSVLQVEVGQEAGASSTLHKGGISPKIASPTSKMVGDGILKDSKKHITSPTAAARGASEACEKWRLRGNQAYANGNLEKAEENYTQGLSCIPQNETSRDCLRAMVLCYSNRAATCMSRGRMREALEDCLVAAEIDPNFFRVQLRAANCYLALGEVGDASRYFKKLLQSTAVCVERKLILEASEGLQKAQKVSQCMDRSAELLLQRTSTDAESVLAVISEALVISPYSEQLLESKAEALFMLRRYEEVIQLCEQSLEAAEKNSTLLSEDGQSSNTDSSEIFKIYSYQIWRYCLIFNSNFCLGRLEDALDFLEKQEGWRSMQDKYGKETVESLIPQLSTVHEMIHHKSAGTEAFQAGRHAEAVEDYTAALALNVESHPFASVCFTSRAAAYQALGQVTDGIADCSLAIALDGNNMKAMSTRASFFEMIRAYKNAAKDLQRIVSLLTKQAEEKGNLLGASSPTRLVAELRQARHRFYQIQEQASKGIPLNFYLILGVEPSVTAADLRKAYRKAALRHHPDKAVQSLARSENGEDKLQKEIAEKVYEDTDELFKMIAQAYAVLSDPAKCSQYDIEEEKRNRQSRSGGIHGTSRMHTDSRPSTVEKSCSSGRQWQEARRSSNPHARGLEPTRLNRYYY